MRKFNLKAKALRRFMEERETGPSAETVHNSTEELNEINGQSTPNEQGFVIAFRTDVGKIRKTNQDAVILGSGLAGIADGMGGHNGGEIASGELRDRLLREAEGQQPDKEVLEQMIQRINYEIWTRQEDDMALEGMGTTLTLLWPTEKEMLIAQVGDSRAYLFRDGELKQVTADHSMVADMVRKGVLTEEQAACHPMRNYITRAVGTEETIDVDLYSVERKQGDRWLVCSDGLYGLVKKAELQEMIGDDRPENAADRMLRSALDRGGRDNVSLVLLYDTVGAAGDPYEDTLERPIEKQPPADSLKPEESGESEA